MAEPQILFDNEGPVVRIQVNIDNDYRTIECDAVVAKALARNLLKVAAAAWCYDE